MIDPTPARRPPLVGSRYRRAFRHLQLRHPLLLVLACALLTALGFWRASRLRLVTDFADLLPPDQPSVVELQRIVQRTRGLSNVFVVLEGPHAPSLRALADRLVPALLALGPPAVETATSGVHAARRFLLPRAGLFLSESHLDRLLEGLREEQRWAFRHEIGADLDDEKPPPSLNEAQLRQQLLGRLGPLGRYSSGYFQGPTDRGTAIIVVVKSAVVAGDLQNARAALERIQAAVSGVTARARAPLPQQALAAGELDAVKVSYAGDLVTGLAEYQLVQRDVVDVGLLGLGLILVVLLLFLPTWRALAALAAAMVAGCAVTFGLAELVLGHLNVASAFQFSIVAGNGINFGIVWLARYREERIKGRRPANAATRATSATWGATLTGACAAAAAYGALAVSSFGAFRHFGLVGAAGMLCCWAASYALLPPLMTMLDPMGRRGPLASAEARRSRWIADRGGVFPGSVVPFHAPFLRLVERAPAPTVVVALLVTIAAAIVGARYVARGPLEYDMRRMQSDPSATADLYRVSAVAARVLGANTEGAMVVLTDDVRDTAALAASLRALRDRAPQGDRPFEEVHALEDFVPPNQTERLAKLKQLTVELRRMRDRGLFDDAAWRDWERLLPPADLRPYTALDLPPEILDLFTEKDGTRGRIVYIEPTAGQSDSDLRYLLRWADAFRQTRLPDGRVVHGSGRAVIFADLLRGTLVDMPRVLVLSLAMTCLAVVLLFRRAKTAAMVLGSLAIALIWVLGCMAALRLRLSFINFIALPITFGIGADYAVNVVRRFEQDQGAGIAAALRRSGGAVVVCSLTTCMGYLVLLRAHSQAVQSLGLLAVLGEVSCIVTAVLVMPAAFTWFERRRGPASVRASSPADPTNPAVGAAQDATSACSSAFAFARRRKRNSCWPR